jgi:hypothetical protein
MKLKVLAGMFYMLIVYAILDKNKRNNFLTVEFFKRCHLVSQFVSKFGLSVFNIHDYALI